MNGPGDTPLGWNIFHATDCEWYTPDGTNNYTFVFPIEGGYWYTANNLFTTNTFDTACVNGNYVGVYVTSSSTGAFNEVITFPNK